MSRAGTVTKTILERIEKKGPGSTWTFGDFKSLPTVAVAKALSRLAKDKKLTRVRKGVYHYSKPTVLGPTTPTPLAVVGATFPITYAGSTTAAYNLGLTTQVPANPVLFGDVSYGKSNFLGTNIRFRKRNVTHLKNLDELEINIIEALRNIKKIPAVSPAEAVSRIKKALKSSSKIRELLKAIENEPPRVRALIGAMCEELGLETDKLKTLRSTLNPLTHYSLEVREALRYADSWRIK